MVRPAAVTVQPAAVTIVLFFRLIFFVAVLSLGVFLFANVGLLIVVYCGPVVAAAGYLAAQVVAVGMIRPGFQPRLLIRPEDSSRFGVKPAAGFSAVDPAWPIVKSFESLLTVWFASPANV